mgnify:CR=1 FL=1
MARPKTYIIMLSDEERAELQKTIHNKNTSKTILKRCQILLELMRYMAQGSLTPSLHTAMRSALPR